MTLLVIGVLMALIAPSLGRVRAKGRETACISQIQQHMMNVGMYTAHSADYWPYPLLDNFVDPYTQSPVGFRSPYSPHGFSWVSSYWHAPMLGAYYGANPFHASLGCPSSPILREVAAEKPGWERAWAIDRGMSMGMYLDPRALNPTAPRWDASLFRPQRVSDVVFPSMKAALYEGSPWHDPKVRWTFQPGRTASVPPPWRLSVAACDGSVRVRNHRDSIGGVVFQEVRPQLDVGLVAMSDAYLYTPHGVRGRDW